MVVCEEMQKLRDWLDEKGIEWEDSSEDYGRYVEDIPETERQWIVGTYFFFQGIRVSVINGFGTYGGFVLNEKDNCGLLEIQINQNEPLGFYTAIGIENLLSKIENEIQSYISFQNEFGELLENLIKR